MDFREETCHQRLLKRELLLEDIGAISINDYPYEVDLAKAELVAMPRELALKAATEVFHRFGWTLAPTYFGRYRRICSALTPQQPGEQVAL